MNVLLISSNVFYVVLFSISFTFCLHWFIWTILCIKQFIFELICHKEVYIPFLFYWCLPQNQTRRMSPSSSSERGLKITMFRIIFLRSRIITNRHCVIQGQRLIQPTTICYINFHFRQRRNRLLLREAPESNIDDPLRSSSPRATHRRPPEADITWFMASGSEVTLMMINALPSSSCEKRHFK